MIKNTHSTRAFIAFLVTWSFVVLTVTGLILYVVPHGRVANWTFWSLAGLDKDGWADVHILFGAVFILAGIWHLYFNWKPFMNYLAQRARGHWSLKRELVTSLVATVLLTVATLYALPPVSWLLDLNDLAKSAWGRAPGQEPPYARAEATPLPVLAQRQNLDLAEMRAALGQVGIDASVPAASLESLAQVHGTTPAALFALLPRPSQAMAGSQDPQAIEARLTGMGIGAKTLADFAGQEAIPLDEAMRRLAVAGIPAQEDETLKHLAERHGTRPIEIAKMLLVSGYTPKKVP